MELTIHQVEKVTIGNYQAKAERTWCELQIHHDEEKVFTLSLFFPSVEQRKAFEAALPWERV